MIKLRHVRIVALAQEHGLVQGRKMRVDTTVVRTNVHSSTDSGLLNDGARVLTRIMKAIEQEAGDQTAEGRRDLLCPSDV